MRQSLNKDHLYLKNCHGEDRVDFFSIISENRHKIGFNYEKADFDRSSVKISYLQQWESTSRDGGHSFAGSISTEAGRPSGDALVVDC